MRVWVIWFSAFCELFRYNRQLRRAARAAMQMFAFSTNFLAAYEPYYLKSVLGYGAEATGDFSALSRIVQIPVRVSCGQLSDRIRCPRGVHAG